MKTKNEFLAEWNKTRESAKTVEINRLAALQESTLVSIGNALADEAASGKNTSRNFDRVPEVDYEPIFAAIKDAGFDLSVFPNYFVVKWAPEEVITHAGAEIVEVAADKVSEVKDASLATRDV